MPVTRSGMAADIEAKLDGYFATTSGSVRADFAAFLAGIICDAAEDAAKTAAGYVTYTTTTTSTAIPVLSNAAGPCVGTVTVTSTSTTTATCTIP